MGSRDGDQGDEDRQEQDVHGGEKRIQPTPADRPIRFRVHPVLPLPRLMEVYLEPPPESNIVYVLIPCTMQ